MHDQMNLIIILISGVHAQESIMRSFNQHMQAIRKKVYKYFGKIVYDQSYTICMYIMYRLL